MKEQLLLEEIELIETHVLIKKRVNEFIAKTKVPVNAYYTAFNGGLVKKKHIDRIRKTLEQFIKN